MTSAPHQPNYKWSQAKSLMPRTAQYEKVSGTVHTVLADGIAVAIIAKTSGKVPNVSDVVLVERRIHG